MPRLAKYYLITLMKTIANGEGRWELIEGIPYAMSPAPIPPHQFISEVFSGRLAWRYE